MTTISFKNSLFAVCLASVLSTSLVYGQAETDNVASSTLSTEVASNTEQEAVPVQPWFKVEQLTGDNLAIGDFVVGPGRSELQIKPGESATIEISVSNRISDNRTFELTVEDMAGTSDASRSVILLGNEKGPYTIKDYITFKANSFVLDLGERARIPVTITIPPDAEPGGHYGSVLISTVQEGELQPGDAARSPIVARVGTLFFVTVPGEITQSGETKEISLLQKKWWYERGPIEFTILYENTGSIHLNPYGELRIKNLLGEEVGFLELEPWFVLPQSLRSRDVTWDRELLFGRYVATAFVNRGHGDIIDERTVVFWVLPWKVMGGMFLVVFIILLGFRLFFRTFEFKRKG